MSKKMKAPKKTPVKALEVTTQYLAKLFEKTEKTISKWKNERGLDVAFISTGKWDLREAVRWWAENVHYPTNNTAIADSRERWEEARAQKLELEVAQTKGEILPAEDVTHALRELIGSTKRAFLLLPHQLPTMLAGKDPAESKEVLENAVDEILKGLAEGATLAKIRKQIKK